MCNVKKARITRNRVQLHATFGTIKQHALPRVHIKPLLTMGVCRPFQCTEDKYTYIYKQAKVAFIYFSSSSLAKFFGSGAPEKYTYMYGGGVRIVTTLGRSISRGFSLFLSNTIEVFVCVSMCVRYIYV